MGVALVYFKLLASRWFFVMFFVRRGLRCFGSVVFSEYCLVKFWFWWLLCCLVFVCVGCCCGSICLSFFDVLCLGGALGLRFLRVSL